jgi:hypothetical protein
MGLKIDSSHVDAQLSKMEVAIENIVSFAAVGNLVVNQLMEHDYDNQGCIYERAQVDHGDGQECALGGQLGCGDPG